MKSILYITLNLFLASAALAERGPLGFGSDSFKDGMETDRPDFTEGTQSIEAGHIQFESGYTYYHDTSDSHVMPELLSRIGVSESFELRIYWEGYNWESAGEDGASDFSLGFKHEVVKDGAFAFSYIFSASIPAGSDSQTADESEPEIKLLWAYDLNEDTAIAGNINLANRNDSGDRYFEPAVSLTAAKEIMPDLGFYTEYFGICPEGDSQNEDEHYINGGFTYMLNADTQLDIRAGFGLNADAANSFSGMGLSWRI